MFRRAAMAVLTAALASSVATEAGAQTPRPLKQWLGEQFQSVARSCLPLSATNQAPERYIPADVRTWDTFANQMDASVPIYSLDSLGSYFSAIYLRGDGGALSRAGQPLGVTYAENEATALYSRRASSTLQHNCSTMLTASGNIDIPLSASVFRAAMSTSATESRSQSIFLYSGRIVSPVAAALGLTSTEVDRRPNVDRFSVYLAGWHWYRLHPGMADDGNTDRLEITHMVDAAAAYRVSGLTQATLMSGNARVAAAVPFLSAAAEASGNAGWNAQTNNRGFGVAILHRPPGGATFPGPRRLSAEAPLLASVTPAAGNAAVIDGPQPIQWSADLSGVPTAYCDRLFWQLTATPDQPSDFSFSNFDVRPAPEGVRVCRFTVRATPASNAGSNVARLAFGVSSQIPTVAEDVAPPLVIPMASTDIADYRASISLANPSGDLAYALNAAPNRGPLTVPLTYLLRESDGRRATEVISGSPEIEITCGQAEPQSVLLGPQDVVFGRSNGEGRITLTARIASGSIFGPDETETTCRLGGKLVVAVQNSAPRTLNLPTHRFTVTEVMPTPSVSAR